MESQSQNKSLSISVGRDPGRCLQQFRADDGLVHLCDKDSDHGVDHFCEVHGIGADLDRESVRRIR
jgi:hypothetical protein